MTKYSLGFPRPGTWSTLPRSRAGRRFRDSKTAESLARNYQRNSKRMVGFTQSTALMQPVSSQIYCFILTMTSFVGESL